MNFTDSDSWFHYGFKLKSFKVNDQLKLKEIAHELIVFDAKSFTMTRNLISSCMKSMLLRTGTKYFQTLMPLILKLLST